MIIQISISQIINVEDMLSEDTEAELLGVGDWTDEAKVEYLTDRFCEDIDMLVQKNLVRDQIEVEYLED
jgi:hypothetical protein